MTVRRPLIAGNWKLHHTVDESLALVEAIGAGLRGAPPTAEVVVAPVFTALHAVGQALQVGASPPIGLAAQDVFWEAQGAYTGEVSVPLLRDVGCSYVIVGHSERRQLFGDGDDQVARKLRAALDGGLQPILCVGETLEERQAGQAEQRVRTQTAAALGSLPAEVLERVVIAYEPIWAIGTGQTAQPSDAQAAHQAIRGSVEEQYGAGVADRLRILYGGSVKPDNARSLLSEADVDGALVGGASLRAESFLEIIRAAG